MIPFTLAENSGLKPINVVTELRKLHRDGIKYAGISLRKNWVVNDMSKEEFLNHYKSGMGIPNNPGVDRKYLENNIFTE